MPVNSGTTCLIKSHGFFHTPTTKPRYSDKPLRQTKSNATNYQMMVTRRTGIVLVRNPFRVIYSFRNYNFMGFYGHAGNLPEENIFRRDSPPEKISSDGILPDENLFQTKLHPETLGILNVN